jgi:nucleoside-diphosphate-sugar epimerase
MKIAITGGSGFIARALAARLAARGDSVTLLSRRPELAELPGAAVLAADVASAASLRSVAPEEGTEAVVHLAASLDYFGSLAELRRVNVAGTMNMLAWAAANGIKRFVLASSVEALGLCAGGAPLDEASVPDPVSPYGRSKLEAESLVSAWTGEGLALRLGNVYGPPSGAFFQPLAAAMSGRGPLYELLPLYGGNLLHPVFVDDAVAGIMAALAPAAPKGTYIIAGERPVSAAELFAAVAAAAGLHPAPPSGGGPLGRLRLALHSRLCRLRRRADLLAYFTAGSGGRVHRAYSIELARERLGYAPAVGLEEGLRRTAETARAAGKI